MIVPDDITGVDADTARRIIVVARSIAPCLDALEEGTEEHKTALAILRGVAAELPAPGERRLRSMSRAGTSVTFETIRSSFTDDDRIGLEALCGVPRAGGPIGSFPTSTPISRIWPEGGYS